MTPVVLTRPTRGVVDRRRWVMTSNQPRRGRRGPCLLERGNVERGFEHHHDRRRAAGSLARSAAAYWTDEQPLIATRHDIERFVREVDALRDDVARAAKRIDNLAARAAAGAPPRPRGR